MSQSAAGDRPTILVGVDGSDASKDALAWAANYAGLVGGELHALSAWEWPAALGIAMALPQGYSAKDDALTVLTDTITAALGASPAVPVSSEVIEGVPAAVLVDAAKQASLLVVGSRGRGGFAELLLGSTSEHCARYAACPVVVVRHHKTGASS